MTEHHFATPEPIDLFVELGKGSVAVVATTTDATTIEISGRDADQVAVHQDGRQISVIGPKQRGGFLGSDTRLDVQITMPTASGATIRTGSADVTVSGSVGTAHLKSGSGDVRLESAEGAVLIETGSGEIRVQEARGALKAKSGSGDVVVGSAAASSSVSTGSGDVRFGSTGGEVVVKTGSGDLEVAESAADVTLTTGSGDMLVGRAHRGRVTAKGASGDVTVRVPAGVPVWTDISTVSGDIRSGLQGAGQPEEGADHVEVRARTVSGDIVLAEA